MNLHTGSRAAITLVFAAALASVTASGTVASARDDTAICIYYGTPYKQEVLVTDANGVTQCMPGAEAAAVAEASGWPNFDSTALGDRLELVKTAGNEAAAWPNFDPTDMTQEIAQYEAQQEAAAWPNYDPRAFAPESSTANTANGPRMTQIAAEVGSESDVAGMTAPYTGSANQRSVELTESREAPQADFAVHQQSGGAF